MRLHIKQFSVSKVYTDPRGRYLLTYTTITGKHSYTKFTNDSSIYDTINDAIYIYRDLGKVPGQFWLRHVRDYIKQIL